MEPDTTTPETAREKGTIVEFGLTTGQTYRALTQKPVQPDGDLLTVEASNGEFWEIRRDYITFWLSYEVDMPTDAEVEEYKASLKDPRILSKIDDVQAAINRIQNSPYL